MGIDRRGLRRGHVVGDNGGSRLIVVWEKRREMVVKCNGRLVTTDAVFEASKEYFSSKFRGMTDRIVFQICLALRYCRISVDERRLSSHLAWTTRFHFG